MKKSGPMRSSGACRTAKQAIDVAIQSRSITRTCKGDEGKRGEQDGHFGSNPPLFAAS